MSGKVSGWVWDQELPVNEKYVLLAYADHADHDGNNVFPSMGLMARKTGYHERHVKRITRVLERKGFLIPVGDQAGGRNRPNQWRIPIYGGVKGDTQSTLSELKGDMGSPKRVTPGAQRVAPRSEKGDIAESPEPSLEPSLEPSVNRGRFPKNDKTPLAQVKASLLRDLFGGQIFAKPPADFERMYGALEMVSIEGSPPVVVLSHPERDLLLQDDRVLNPLLSAFVGVLGSDYVVKIEEAGL